MVFAIDSLQAMPHAFSMRVKKPGKMCTTGVHVVSPMEGKVEPVEVILWETVFFLILTLTISFTHCSQSLADSCRWLQPEVA